MVIVTVPMMVMVTFIVIYRSGGEFHDSGDGGNNDFKCDVWHC